MPFVLYDNGSDSERLIIFGTEIGLNLLADNDKWFMDGTFDTAPRQFEQLFVIRVPNDNSAMSAVYAFLPSKTQAAYEECFTALLDTCLERDIRVDPSVVVTDFELSIHNAVRSMFGNHIDIQGCFYHLTQSTWRKIQSEGLSSLYKEEENVRHFAGMIDGLAFLPVEDVSDGMQFLKDNCIDEMEPILDYFDSNYVSGGFKAVRGNNGILRMRRTPPRYPPQTWNVHQATVNDTHRTNNICESSWNNGFRHLVGHSNPGLWNVIQCLQKDHTLVSTEVERINRGEPSSKRVRKASANLQKRLKTLCQQYDDGRKTLSEFLNAVGQCIRL